MLPNFVAALAVCGDIVHERRLGFGGLFKKPCLAVSDDHIAAADFDLARAAAMGGSVTNTRCGIAVDKYRWRSFGDGKGVGAAADPMDASASDVCGWLAVDKHIIRSLHNRAFNAMPAGLATMGVHGAGSKITKSCGSGHNLILRICSLWV
ncbi:MAG: hypothetical protein PVH87_22135 [Desulfobacteraceae bacterium]